MNQVPSKQDFAPATATSVAVSDAVALPSLPAAPIGFAVSAAKRAASLSWKGILLLFIWLIPSVVTGIYLFGFASNQYIAEFRFNLRSSASQPAMLPGMGAGGGGLAGLSPTIVWDSHVIAQYIKSQDVVAEIDRRFGFSTIYRPSGADFFFRFGKAKSLEEKTDYWRSVVDPFFDMQTGVISVKIRAFSPEDAHRVASLVLELAEKTVNDMSERSRQDSLSFARTEVAKAEEKLREAQLAMRNFRNVRELINPVKEAEQSVTMLARQREEIGRMKSELNSLSTYLSPESPSIRVLRSKIAAAEVTIGEEQQRIASSGSGGARISSSNQKAPDTLSYALTDFETLVFEQTFRERSYALAQEALQKARVEADKQHLYLNAFVKPRIPEESLFPNRGKALVIVTFALFIIWSLVCLVIYSVRDHV